MTQNCPQLCGCFNFSIINFFISTVFSYHVPNAESLSTFESLLSHVLLVSSRHPNVVRKRGVNPYI